MHVWKKPIFIVDHCKMILKNPLELLNKIILCREAPENCRINNPFVINRNLYFEHY